MRTTAVVSQVGGTGKTSLSLALGATFAAQGHLACVVDLDFGGSQMAGLFPECNTYHSNQLLSLARGVVEKVERLKLGMLYKEQGTHLVVADPKLDKRIAMLGQQGIGNVHSLSHALLKLVLRLKGLGIEQLILDTPPGFAWWTEAAMRVVGWESGNLVCCARENVSEVDPFIFFTRSCGYPTPALVLNKQTATGNPAPVNRTLAKLVITVSSARMPLLQAPGAASQVGNQAELDMIAEWVTTH